MNEESENDLEGSGRGLICVLSWLRKATDNFSQCGRCPGLGGFVQANMAPNGERCVDLKGEKDKCLQFKVTINPYTDGKNLCNERINVDREELVKFYEKMKKLGNQISQTATSSRDKVAIQQKVKSMVRKIDSIIEEAKRSEQCIQDESENMKGKSACDKQQFVQYTIPVINNRYELTKSKKRLIKKNPMIEVIHEIMIKSQLGRRKAGDIIVEY
jgi:hypothetical protein